MGGFFHVGSWFRRFAIAWAILAGIAFAECLFRESRVQSHFWTILLRRMNPADWAMREPARLRFEVLHPDDPTQVRTGISVFGSSQSAVNLDRKEMARVLGRPVYRRALNGMLALELSSAQYLLSVPRTGTAVFYLSPLDVGGTFSVRADWMRSLICPRSWLDVVRVLGPRLAWRNRGPLAELALAACLKLWAFRDGARWLLFNLAGRPRVPTLRNPDGESGLPQQQLFVVDSAYVEASFRGYGLVFDNLKRWGFDVVVFEGEINPVLRRQIPDEYWLATEARIRSFLREHHVRHVLLSEYRPNIGPQDWLDNTHLNDGGRCKLTGAVIPVLQARLRDCDEAGSCP